MPLDVQRFRGCIEYTVSLNAGCTPQDLESYHLTILSLTQHDTVQEMEPLDTEEVLRRTRRRRRPVDSRRKYKALS